MPIPGRSTKPSYRSSIISFKRANPCAIASLVLVVIEYGGGGRHELKRRLSASLHSAIEEM